MKIPQLTFTRFLAAMAIVVYHLGADVPPFQQGLMQAWLPNANILVSYFFVLSGFILVVSSGRNGELPAQVAPKAFLINRFARIYPLYALALLVSLGLLAGMRQPNNDFAPYKIALAFTLLQSWVPSDVSVYNYPGWSLSVEMLFYVTFPLFYPLLVRVSSRGLGWLAAAVWLAGSSLHVLATNANWAENFTHYFPLGHLPTFLFGMSIGILFMRHFAQWQQAAAGIQVAALIALAGHLGLLASHSPVLAYDHNTLYAPLFMLYIIAIALNTGWVARLFSSKPFELLGEISYGIYIMHIPIYILVGAINNRLTHVPDPWRFYVYLVLLLMSCTVLYFGFEKPARIYVRRLLTRQTPAPHAVLEPAGS